MNLYPVNVVIVAFLLLIAGCGGDDGGKEEKTDGEEAGDEEEIGDNAGVDEGGQVGEEDGEEDDEAEDEDEEESYGEDDAGVQNAVARDPLVSLASKLETRRYRIALKERELIQREKMMTALETEAIEQAAHLQKIKSEVAAQLKLLEKRTAVEKSKLRKYHEEMAARYADATQAQEDEKIAAQDEKERRILEREERITHLMKTVKGMRPAAGAGLLSSMDMRDAIAVLRQLGARQTAALMGQMPPEKAAQLAEGMLGPRESADAKPLPEVPETVKEATR